MTCSRCEEPIGSRERHYQLEEREGARLRSKKTLCSNCGLPLAVAITSKPKEDR